MALEKVSSTILLPGFRAAAPFHFPWYSNLLAAARGKVWACNQASVIKWHWFLIFHLDDIWNVHSPVTRLERVA